ncbi:MAG: YbaB/EbfC family nucleoid-associated protein [Clostridia bacterium]|nr:YbaB/EbfC family nucleoid-associated protein [Clostridia bacterium]
MKARLPKGYNNGGNTNIQQLARQAQKMQEEMDAASKELDEKEYSATAGGGAVTAVVKGNLEIQSIDISKDVVDPEDIDMLSDLIIASVNEAIRKARDEKAETMDQISGGLNVPGLF